MSVPSTIYFRFLNRFTNSRLFGSCQKPKEGCTSSCYSSVSPHVIRQLAPELRHMLSFSKSGPFGNASLVYLVDSLLAGAGSGFQGISTAVADATESVFASRELSRMHQAKKQQPIFQNVSMLEDSLLNKAVWLAPRAQVLVESFVAYGESMEGEIQKSFLENARDADALAIDMVHPNGHDGTSEGQVGLNNVLHPNGKVICTQMQEADSMKMTEPLLRRIQSTSLVGVKGSYVDAPAKQSKFHITNFSTNIIKADLSGRCLGVIIEFNETCFMLQRIL